MFESNNVALIIIDCQQAIDSFSTSARSDVDAEDNIAQLLAIWRQKSWPCIHIRHASKHQDSPYHASKPSFAFKPQLAPHLQEHVVTKSENDAFVGTELESLLRSLQISEIVVCGVLTHHSVDASVRHAAALGFRVWVPSNCTASFPITLFNGQKIDADLVQQLFLSNLDGEYCAVVHSYDIASALT